MPLQLGSNVQTAITGYVSQIQVPVSTIPANMNWGDVEQMDVIGENKGILQKFWTAVLGETDESNVVSADKTYGCSDVFKDAIVYHLTHNLKNHIQNRYKSEQRGKELDDELETYHGFTIAATESTSEILTKKKARIKNRETTRITPIKNQSELNKYLEVEKDGISMVEEKNGVLTISSGYYLPISATFDYNAYVPPELRGSVGGRTMGAIGSAVKLRLPTLIAKESHPEGKDTQGNDKFDFGEIYWLKKDGLETEIYLECPPGIDDSSNMSPVCVEDIVNRLSVVVNIYKREEGNRRIKKPTQDKFSKKPTTYKFHLSDIYAELKYNVPRETIRLSRQIPLSHEIFNAGGMVGNNPTVYSMSSAQNILTFI